MAPCAEVPHTQKRLPHIGTARRRDPFPPKRAGEIAGSRMRLVDEAPRGRPGREQDMHLPSKAPQPGASVPPLTLSPHLACLTSLRPAPRRLETSRPLDDLRRGEMERKSSEQEGGSFTGETDKPTGNAIILRGQHRPIARLTSAPSFAGSLDPIRPLFSRELSCITGRPRGHPRTIGAERPCLSHETLCSETRLQGSACLTPLCLKATAKHINTHIVYWRNGSTRI